MKAPLSWIKEMTDINISPVDFADKMTMSGSKVEAIINQGEVLNHVVVGQIIDIRPHENAEKLNVCQVSVGDETLQIVCGAPNAEQGMKCPVALIGAILPGGFHIKKAKLRGVESFGMCCAADELDFNPDDFEGASENGLWRLDNEAMVGQSFAEYLGLNDTIIDFEITSNRPDCFAIEGLAREGAVALGSEFRPLESTLKVEGQKDTSEWAQIEIMAPDLCYRYCSRTVEDVHIGPSPKWMQNRLRAAGLRPINNIVDITNYVCLEMGQPMHAFDLDYLAGNHIIVRQARENETTVTLDEIERNLDTSMLVIADEEKVCALAGVMGSHNSEVSEKTQTILFESATFHPLSVRKTAAEFGLRTEASLRYEKGLDPENALRALDRACALVELLDCGRVSKGLIDVYPTQRPVARIEFEPDRINALLGTSIDDEYMRNVLTALGARFEEDQGKTICVAPTYRPDLVGMADLAEEVARFYDYNNIVPTMLSGKQTTIGGRTHEQKIVEEVKDVFVAQGYFEAITYSFESPKELDYLQLPQDDECRKQVVISNPIGEDYSVMRTSMMPSMLRIAGRNFARSVSDAHIFEIAYVYHPSEQPDEQLPMERQVLSAFAYDEKESFETAQTFFKVKGTLVMLFSALGIENFSFESVSDVSYLHPGRACEVYIDNQKIGFMGYIHPDVARRYECSDSTVVLSINVAELIAAYDGNRSYTPLPKYPGISRDIAILVDKDIAVGEIERIMLKNGGSLLVSCVLFDVYEGKQLESSKKSVAFSLLFRSPERTLNETDIKPNMDQIITALADQIGAELR